MPEDREKSREGSRAPGSGNPEPGTIREPNLEGRLERLDEIVSALETEDLELDRALALFEEGVGHVRQARKILSEAELKVEELLGDEEALETRPLEEGDEE